MFKSIKIENFRCFPSFELQQLGRVNLLVGKNNSGKTSILEAIQILCSRTNLEPLAEIMINRGEYLWNDDSKGRRELDIRHLFSGHEIEAGSDFSVLGINDDIEEKIFFLIKIPQSHQLEFNVKWSYRGQEVISTAPLSIDGSLFLGDSRRLFRDYIDEPAITQFVTSSSLTTEKMIELFEQVVLTPEEKLVEEALQTIEPKIERIAPVGYKRFRSSESRTGFLVRLSDSNQRVPIGSMGDGIWRILGLALAIVCAKDGFLFVDEIDTGLHFTAMSDMWKLIWETAKKLNVQVFATTHNSDCWTSLATIAREEEVAEDGITIQRIEKGKQTAVAFTEREIVIAAERGIEVR
ncbi:AAA family ATPase [Calothrix rhizosoleniae]|uniref:AAA family ATPase n=1 Tax=Calothrix rhizosoleniae TaxID=888997 RepID=UPI000B49D792|nr:ATP-binding protein [Calothrix rhizosoleniae]